MEILNKEENLNVDKVMEQLENIFEENFSKKKKTKVKYEYIINSIKKIQSESTKFKKEVLTSVKYIINSNSNFNNFESLTWSNLFIIIGLFLTITSDLILSNYESFSKLIPIQKEYIVALTVVFISLEIIIYIYYYIKCNNKIKRKCFYEFVYSILTDI